MLLALFVVLVILFVVLPLIGLALWAILSALVVGAVIGALARLILPGRAPIGALPTVLLGWIGAVVGSSLGEHVWGLGWFATVLIEIGCAAVLIAVWSAGDRRAIRR